MHRNLLALSAILAMQAAALEAGAAGCTAPNPNASVIESTPTSAFTDHGNGTVTHHLTGLVWKQCLQDTSGANCATGNAAAMTWRAALKAAVADTTAGYSDWRLPNLKELQSIVEFCGYLPALNQTVFPIAAAVSTLYFWTATSYGRTPSYAWFVNFDSGNSSSYSKTANFAVRLVRGGPPRDAFDAAFKPVVVEYRNDADFPNSPGGHYFYSADPVEQAGVDAGAAGDFFRTGRQFLTGGTLPVCRFYGSMSPGPNSHFFTVDVAECNTLKAAQVTPTPTAVQQWNFEGLGYATTPPIFAASGARSCPPNTLPVYRAYNNAYPLGAPKNPWDSNHRFTQQPIDIADMMARGWRDEGLVFCAAQQ